MSSKILSFTNFDRLLCYLFVIYTITTVVDSKWADESVWTEKLGEELWAVSKLATKHSEIKSRYTALNTTVKDGEALFDDIIKNVDRMLRRKVSAVKCIASAAEKLRRNVDFAGDFKLEYHNMKYSLAEGSDYTCAVPWQLDGSTEYKNMTLKKNSNFYNIPVNTSYSAVHIPTNVYDRLRTLAETITWSENLDGVFSRNYNADPSLSWQYFGSSSGMMRQFPAMQWNTNENDVDLYDCRMRPWFIEAATCSKDVVILMDNSGSMTGMRNTIAKLVVNSLLKTFGNNDFINVLKFSWQPESVLPCCKDTLVQATPVIVKSFQEAVSQVKPEGNASFSNAFSYSLRLLHKYRENRLCGDDGGSNQAIMLVTDGVPGNVTDVFEAFNSDEHGVPPVRVFTYLVGNEVKGVQDLQMMACKNRGYYVHIHDLDEVHDQVLKYISVIARPLVLQRDEHPVTWTHAFADINDPKLTTWLWKVMSMEEQEKRLRHHQNIKAEYFSMQKEDSKYVQKITQVQGEEKEVEYQEYHLMTSVSVPVFDKRENNETKNAELLGVAGADLPLNQIQALSYPYKSGSNGYIFMVNNNGFLLLHPDLRPVHDGALKLNFNSVDLAKVEFLDEEKGYKEFSADILDMQRSMVDGTENFFLEKRVKFHYNDMLRVGTEKRNFYVKPLSGTPFSIGLSLPSDHASYLIINNLRVESNEVNLSKEKASPDNLLKNKSKNGRDNNWLIHPDWIYCKFHFHGYKTFRSKEDEVMHFLKEIGKPNWRWKKQYDDGNEVADDDCERPGLDEDDYYCDRDLVELLMADAEVLQHFGEPAIPKNVFETKLLDIYKPNLRFVASQSGLTKWQFMPERESEETETDGSEFITAFPRSIDEPWYKMAVLQNRVDEESFVFSVPFKASEAHAHVTATHAIFHKKTHDGKRAPAAVVGYRFDLTAFYDRFMKITSETDRFTLPCDSDARECYVLDHNGYVVISSKSPNETGVFFGELEGSVMSVLVDLGIYESKTIFDYQGLCTEEITVANAANIMLAPWISLRQFLNFMFAEFSWNVLWNLSMQVFKVDLANSLSDTDDFNEFRDYDSDETISGEEEFQDEKEESLNGSVRLERKTWPCDKNKTLYLLQQNIFSSKHIYGVRHNSSRFRFVNRISHTNLILVVINTLYNDFDDIKLSIKSEVMPPEKCETCTNVLELPRSRFAKCFSHHSEEMQVEACGEGHRANPYRLVHLVIVVLLISGVLGITF